MKKAMIAAAFVCAAAMSQAAQINWSTTAMFGGVNAAEVDGNGSYAASTYNLKNHSTLTYALTLYSGDGESVVFTKTDAMKFSTTGGKTNVSWSDSKIQLSTAYQYEIVVSGTQESLTALGIKGDWDYTDATISTTLKGSITTLGSGATTLNKNVESWTVAGVKSAGPTPEPTSGLLLLLGVAGLALRRRHA